MDFPFGLNPFDNDPGAWGASLLFQGELLISLLDAAGARSVIEVGAYAGDLTRLLVLWAEGAGASVSAIDPAPQPELIELDESHPELKLVRQTSLEALPGTPPTDAVILDGDHNWYTVTEELEAIATWDADWPLVLLHDVGWPHGRRDDYFEPQQIPDQFRQVPAPETALYPGNEGTQAHGLRYHWPAAREGGPHNGVRRAVEDFVADRRELRFVALPAFFGLGVVWRADAPWSAAIDAIVAPRVADPVLARLETNRVLHLASAQVQYARAAEAEQRLAKLEPLLEAMLNSRAFWAAETFLRIRQGGNPIFSRRAIRQARER